MLQPSPIEAGEERCKMLVPISEEAAVFVVAGQRLNAIFDPWATNFPLSMVKLGVE